MTKEEKRAIAKQAAAEALQCVAAVFQTEAAIAKAQKEAWIVEHMRVRNVGRETAEKKHASMHRHGLV